MEIIIKCDKDEQVEIHRMVSNLCPALSDEFFNDIEIRSFGVRFCKTEEEIKLNMASDVSKMAIRKISTVGNVLKILWSIMNDSIADLADKMGEFDILINGKLVDDDYTTDNANRDTETSIFVGV